MEQHQMPSEKNEHSPDRSWRTRMQSVMRQFESLTREEVIENSTLNSLRVVGLYRIHGKVRLTVAPVEDCLQVFSTDLEEVSL